MPLELPASLAVVAEAIPVAARSHPDVFVLDTSDLPRLYLADGLFLHSLSQLSSGAAGVMPCCWFPISACSNALWFC